MPSARSFVLLALSLALFLALAVNLQDARRQGYRGLRPLNPSSRFARTESALSYETKWFGQQTDHFNFQNSDSYMQRYLWADKYWGTKPLSKSCPGPIFFYTGNEGDITWFYNNTGFLTDVLAQEFGALLIFAEHRYYGESMPYGNKSFEPQYLGPFTTEQALADYAVLLTTLKSTLNIQSCPVVAFGGSYGGMLAGWFRLKYPNVVTGAIAASAPIFMFYTTGVSQWSYMQTNTRTFAAADPKCPMLVNTALNQIQSLGQSSSGLTQLQKAQDFSLCTPLSQSAYDLIEWLESGFQYMAMADYPYPANFLAPMPGNPVNVFCSQLAAWAKNTTLTIALANAIGVYYNYTGWAGSCYNTSVYGSSALGNNGWDYQACTEMVMPISSNGTSDMFLPAVFNLAAEVSYCSQTYKTVPRPDWVPTFFGANSSQLAGGSNIVWTNGALDPWSPGGVLTSPNPSQPAILIPNSAHHLDLRTPNPLDPPGVVSARAVQVSSITKWIAQSMGDKVKQA